MQRQRVLIRDLVYQAIREVVINGELAPSERVTEQMLSEQFGMSRTPLREALARLEQEQLINRLPNGALKIADLNHDQLSELFDIQERIEAIIVASLARKKVIPAVQKIQHTLIKQEQYLEKKSIKDMYLLDSKFHKILREFSSKNQAKSILERFIGLFERYYHLAPHSAEIAPRMQAMYTEHQLILSSILEGDPVWAEMAIKNHVRNEKKFLLHAYHDKPH